MLVKFALFALLRFSPMALRKDKGDIWDTADFVQYGKRVPL